MIVALQGGLGNQIFQMAFGFSVAKKRGEEVFFTRWRVDSDPNGRKYGLDAFAAEIKIVPEEIPPIVQDTWFYNPGVYTEGNSFIGHFQTEKYFDEPLVREITQLRDYPKPLAVPYQCAIHVRRGDYTLPDRIAYHGNVSMDYYRRAMDYVLSQEPQAQFIVFSDDPEWCRANFPNIAVAHESAHVDLWLMAHCRHAIIPNSTFGWWGAWLGDTQPNRIVIAPKRWFACGLNSSDVIPERWLKFDN